MTKEVKTKTNAMVGKVSYGEVVDQKIYWEEVVEKFEKGIDLELCYYSERFCRQMNRKWKNHSLFCDKMAKDCSKCPLSPCYSKASAHGKADNCKASFEERIAGAKEILEICEYLQQKRKPVEMKKHGTLFLR